MEESHLLPQPVCALAQRGDAPSDRRHMLPDGEVEPLDKGGLDLPATGRQHLLDGLQGPEHHAVAHADQTPTPYQSGESAREQGISKSGNRHVRWMTTELAWSWLRYQPDSALSVWFRERFGSGGKRLRRIGIVAVARKLLIALWRFLETGGLPEGAVLKEG